MTTPIDIQVKTVYLPEQSEPEANRFVFRYTITIANQSDVTAQLISRYWLITDAADRVQEVRGLGVIGEQPHILPGEAYTYTSGAILETQTGIMQGSYEMHRPDGSHFTAEIPAFALVPPHAVH